MSRPFRDFDTPKDWEKPYGSMNEFGDETLAARQCYRRPPDDVDEGAVDDLIRSVVIRVQDVHVSGSCIKSKIRPDKLYVELARRRRSSSPP